MCRSKRPGRSRAGSRNVGAVGGGDQDDRLGLLKTVHLNQQLVQRLLALVMTAAQTSAALATDGVDLIDKDNRGRLRLGLGKQVAHAACTHAHEHFDKVRAGNAKERYARLAGNRFGKQRLYRYPEGQPAARRAESWRPTCGSAPARLGSRGSPQAPRPPHRCPQRP